MPFKLRLKKSRAYTVSSKNLFVLSVELLDNTTVECTLSAQSTGHECLANVCQRLQLQQMQYFGLRFVSKRGPLWWVDMQRPLKRQLDKYALDGCNLVYLQVMFFVPDVNILHDEVTRYHYFLQLKSDILEGKLCCNEEQTILFASYSLQAEFGDHDPERHTTEYLTNFGLLPKHLAGGKGREEEAVLERVIQCHRGLQGMSQQMAEVYYIVEAQRIDGYGLECFAAKDSSSTAIIVGVSLAGIYIWYLNSQPSIYFSWDQILNLVHHKRCFGVEHRNGKKVLQIYMEDSLSAKYLWKTCIQQHGFYTKNEGLLSTPSEQAQDTRPPNAPSANAVSRNPSTVVKVEVRSQHTMQESQDSLDGLGVYHTDGRYSERIVSSKSCNHLVEGREKVSLSNAPSRNTSSTCLSTASTGASQQHIAGTIQHPSSSAGDLSEVRRKSSSDASLHRPSVPREVPSECGRPVCSVLPIYRHAPDYDTAVKLKYGLQSCSTGDMPNSHLVAGDGVVQQMPQAQYRNYADLSHLDITEVGKGTNLLVRNQGFVSAPSLHPPVQAYGTMEQTGAQVVYHFKPPPPYPYTQRSSSSTPDLSRNNQVVSSHPAAVDHPELHPAHSLEPICAKIVTSNAVQHQTIASSQRVHSTPVHSYENCAPVAEDHFMPQSEALEQPEAQGHAMGPMLVAAMNGLSLSRPSMFSTQEPAQETRSPKDARIQALESRLSEGQVFLEFERIVKRNPNSTFATALLPENAPRNRFKDVFPYEENRVRLTPTSENTTGYINASHMSVSMGAERRSYIAAQGPLPNTLYSFWQMVWEHHAQLIVMLTEVKEEGRDKCFPYWPQEDGKQLQIGEFQITRHFSLSSPTYVTCSLSLRHILSQRHREVWHVQYTDWPDHSCPQDTQGFIAFMGEVDAVRRHAGASGNEEHPAPTVVHCSAGVGRSGAVILTDIMLHCLDHNQTVDLPNALTHLRLQRMLTVQTVAQYKFVYSVLIQYLKNSRLI